MTARSQRRAAEMAVIDAAVNWQHAVQRVAEDQPIGWTFSHYLSLIARAVDALEALGLEQPGETRANRDAPQTAHDAAEWMRPRVKELAGQVFAEILLASAHHPVTGGLTCDAVEARLNMSHQTVSPRFTELRDKGWIKASGVKMKTRSGRKADRYVPTMVGFEAARLIPEWSWRQKARDTKSWAEAYNVGVNADSVDGVHLVTGDTWTSPGGDPTNNGIYTITEAP